jgi:hypothetical protein
LSSGHGNSSLKEVSSPTKEIAANLGISPRTFHRERRAAVEAMATVVWQVESQLHPREATGWGALIAVHARPRNTRSQLPWSERTSRMGQPCGTNREAGANPQFQERRNSRMGYAVGYLGTTFLIGVLGFLLIRSGLKLVQKDSNKKARGWISLALGILFILGALLNVIHVR